jgi:hypothetical protein
MTRSSPARLTFLIALLCAVGLRLLTPAGWMPNLDGHGGAPLVICTGDGVHTVPPADHGPHAPGGKEVHDVCAFAGFALGEAPHAAAFAAPEALAFSAAAPLPADQVRLAPTWRRSQAPRAPPLFA